MTDDAYLAELAAAHQGLLLREWLVAAGVTPDAMRQRLTRRRWIEVHPGVYRIAGAPVTWQQRLLAAQLAAGQSAAVSHRGALAWWGIDGAARGTVELAVPRRQWPRLEGVLKVHRATDLFDHHVVVSDGIRITKPARTLVDYGAVAPVRAVAAAYRHAVGKKLVTASSVQAVVDELGRKGRRGVGVMRRVLEENAGVVNLDGYLAAKGAEILLAHGLPLGVAEYEIYDHNGLFVARVDRAWPEVKFCAEFDGNERHLGETEADVERQNAIQAAGWDIRRFGYRHVTREQEYVARTIRRVLTQLGFFLVAAPGVEDPPA